MAKDADVEALTKPRDTGNNAVDGKNVMESFWGTRDPRTAKDSLTVTFKNGVQNIDDVRLYFYQTSSSQTIAATVSVGVHA